MSEEKTILQFETYMFGLKSNDSGFLKVPKEQYELTNERLKINKQGVIGAKKSDIELYIVKEISVSQKLKDKMMDVGDIEIITTDGANVVLKRIKSPQNVREQIRSAVKNAREAAGVSYRVDL